MIGAWSLLVDDSPSYVWEHKLKHIKIALKSWIKKPVSTPYSHRKESVQALEEIQFNMEDLEITKPLLMKEHSAQNSSFLSFRQEEEQLQLKSRSLWLLASDKSLAFFHKQCRARISLNHILEINSSDEEVIKGHLKIQQAALSHF